MNYCDKVRSYIEENLIIFDDDIEIQNDDNIFEQGFVNSLFAMKLVKYIEDDFSIKLENEDLNISNFSSINKIVQLVQLREKEQLPHDK